MLHVCVHVGASVCSGSHRLSLFSLLHAMQDFSTGRDAVRDQIERFSDPTYGQDAFMNMVGQAAPTINDFTARQAANGGSSQMAREQAQSARQQTFSQGLDALNQMQRSAQQTAAQQAQGLMQDDTQRWQTKKQLAFKRDQLEAQQGGLGSMLGSLAGTAAGAFLGPMGAQAGGNLGSKIGGMFGGGGGSGSLPSPKMSFGIDSY